jgi:hypothetical protein
MAVRLTVIMIESAPPTAAAGRLAEDIVGHLIGRPGIDLTLVRSISGLQPDSTDQLTLESVTGDVAVLDWNSAESIVDSLHQLGFSGSRSPHRFDSQVAASPIAEPRIYAFDLRQFSDATRLTKALDALRSERQVRTFSIGSISPTVAKPPPAARPAPATAATDRPAAGNDEDEITQSRSDQSRSDQSRSDGQRPSEIDLDDLIDQLDQSDT